MGFPIRDCTEILLQGLLGALAAHADYIRPIRNARGDHPACGLDFELVPWHAACHLSLCCSSHELNANRRDPDSWEHGYFAESPLDSGAMLRGASQFIGELYQSSQEGHLRETAHMIFLAGAEALLDPRVATLLQKLGVNAPIIQDAFLHNDWFEYMVFDSDRTINANYCEIVIANRIASRLLSEQPQG